jgi:protein associated with RNAse G/E
LIDFVSSRTEIAIQTYKYDGTPHRTWTAEVLERRGDLLMLLGVFDRDISHPQLGNIARGTQSYEYYWLDKWYNVFRFHEPGGSFRNFYCNVNMPPTFNDGVLSYIDLDIDIYISKKMEIEIWDVDEFDENISRYSYPPEIISKARETVEDLQELITAKRFPFNDGPNGFEFKL